MAEPRRRIVSFELPETVFKALEDDAQACGSNSVHQRSRDILVEHFTNPATLDLQDQLSSLDMDVAWLGELLRRVAYSVIVHAAGNDSTKANAWIRENLTRSKERP